MIAHSFPWLNSERRRPTVWLFAVWFLVMATVPAGPVAAQITRVAANTLQFPQTPQSFGYSTEAAFPGLTFSQPLGIVTAPGETDRVYILEKTGKIQAVSGLGGTPTKQVFLDLSARVLTSSEQGLLGLAFHPDYATNRYFYVFYSTTATTAAGTGAHQRIARFTALPAATNAQVLATEVPLISQFDEADNHNGGDLQFGPDGYLYISVGDEGGANDQFGNSQLINRDFFAGLLRIDVDQRASNLVPNAHSAVHPGTYRVPADNPFVGATTFNGAAILPGAVRTEFWAVGLRNPWRFSFDFPTGRLFAGDVGQGAREEIDLILRGTNYGWNYREGTVAGPRGGAPAGVKFADPVWEGDRSLANSITGGLVYRGTRFAQLFGKYVFGDYGQNRIFAMSFNPDASVQVQQIATESSPAGFGVDPRNGDILIASIGSGVVRRLVYNSTASGSPLPATLSATGAFSSVSTLTPAPGIVGYEPNVSFWSDHARKRRWFGVPVVADKITFAGEGNWSFPAGTVWIKHFDLDLTRGDATTARRLETRFLVKTSAGVYGATYRWNQAQTEATLVPEEGATETITVSENGVLRNQVWRYPSRSECLQCHTAPGGFALSFNTPQLNRTFAYASGPSNQLAALAGAGYFNATINLPSSYRALAPAADTTASLEYRVRSYLAANCVQCHQPNGAAQGKWDARIETPTAAAGIVNGSLVNQGADSANRVVVLGDAAHSQLLARISTRGAARMPPVGSNEIDAAGIALVTAWITGEDPVVPQITTQPANQVAVVGTTVLFSVAATGTPAPTYQWSRDGAAIAGANQATLTLPDIQLNAAGIYTVRVTNSFGVALSEPVTLTVLTTRSPGDFNRDGYSDILWENSVTGERALWLLRGTTFLGSSTLGIFPPEWSVAATGDFNADGNPDIVWSNRSSGERALWLMQGANFLRASTLGFFPLEWTIAATGDFNQDGKTDLVWSNSATGERALWLMDGTTFLRSSTLGLFPKEWSVVATGDFNADAKTDLVWSNALTGERAIWLMNGPVFLSSSTLGLFPKEWTVGGSGDFNLDGKPDLVWQNSISGERALWLMNGTAFLSSATLGIFPLEWTIRN